MWASGLSVGMRFAVVAIVCADLVVFKSAPLKTMLLATTFVTTDDHAWPLNPSKP